MTALQQGFLLTRHWRDTPAGTEVEFWLATDAGPRQLRLPPQTSVAFIPAEQRQRAELLPTGNWMYPVINTPLPVGFEQMNVPQTALQYSAEEVATQRGGWIRAWQTAVSR